MSNFTNRIRSMGEGTVFTDVCHSFCPGGGRLPQLLPGRGYLVRTGWGGVFVWSERVSGWGGRPPPLRDGYCRCRYPSYWNAFLLMFDGLWKKLNNLLIYWSYSSKWLTSTRCCWHGISVITTACQRSPGKVMFLFMSVCLFKEIVYLYLIYLSVQDAPPVQDAPSYRWWNTNCWKAGSQQLTEMPSCLFTNRNTWERDAVRTLWRQEGDSVVRLTTVT